NEGDWLFYHPFKDDPKDLFLDLQKKVPAHEVVQEYFEQTHKHFQETCAPYFDPEDLDVAKNAAEEIVEWSKEVLLWDVLKSNSRVHLEKQVMVQKQHQKQLEVNVEIQKETQKELQKYAVRHDAPPARFIRWEKLKEPPQSFKDYKIPELLT